MDSVVHFEIPADNTARAQKFYQKAFGWEINFMKEFDYFSVKTRSKYKGKLVGIDGGMMKRKFPAQPVTVYLHVKSIDAALKKVKANGGKVCMPKTPLGKGGKAMGAIAMFIDPEGNMMGLHEM